MTKETLKKILAGKTCRVDEELLTRDGADIQSWRIFKIMAEFVNGFELLRKYGLAATIFGSSRCNSGNEVYQMSEDLAAKLSKEGFTIMTGGGGGVMEGANKGAYEAKGKSVGLNIRLPHDAQEPNHYTTDAEHFDYFFTRKVMLSYASEVYIFLPGGFGTLDEFFEIVTLIQTKKIKNIPIVLIGKEFWMPLLVWIEDAMLHRYRTIDAKDMEIYHLVDSVDEAVSYIVEKVC